MSVKVGDKIRYIGPSGDDLTHGKVYEVEGVLARGLQVLDDVGDYNGIAQCHYEPVTDTPPDRRAHHAPDGKARANPRGRRDADNAGQARSHMGAAMTRREELERLLATYDKFMAGEKMTDAEMETFRAVATASTFAAAAYDEAAPYSHAASAMARSFLIALIDPNDPQLDYLRAKLEALARGASAHLKALIAQEGQE